MTAQTRIAFTQNGRTITITAGFIVGISAFGIRAMDIDGVSRNYPTIIITNLGFATVDQEPELALSLWQRAMKTPAPQPAFHNLRENRPLGNDAEF